MTDRPLAADHNRLRTPGYYEDFGGYLREAWRRRHFAWHLARGRVEDGFERSRLGWLWLIIDPLIMVAIYGVVFGTGLRGARDIPNFVLWLLVGQVTFRSMQRVAKTGAGSLVTNQSLLKSYAFPRVVILMAESQRALIQSFPAFVLLGVSALFFRQWPNLHWLALPLVLGGAFVMCFGIGGVLARWTYILPDVDQITNALFRVLFFASFVFFPAERFLQTGSGASQQIYEMLPIVNPFYSYICLIRWVLLSNGGDQMNRVTVSAIVWSVMLASIGTWYFYRGELTYSGARIYKARRKH